MFEQDGVLVVEVGLSGVRFEDVSVRVHGAHLVVSARHPQKGGERRYHLRGRRAPQELLREVLLPPHACPDQATATYVHGLLRVCIPLGSEESRFGTAIPVKDLVDARAGEELGGSPAGAGTANGGAVPVPGAGVPSQQPAATVRRCALCNAWMDGEPSAAPATRIRYDLCADCQPRDRKRRDRKRDA